MVIFAEFASIKQQLGCCVCVQQCHVAGAKRPRHIYATNNWIKCANKGGTTIWTCKIKRTPAIKIVYCEYLTARDLIKQSSAHTLNLVTARTNSL